MATTGEQMLVFSIYQGEKLVERKEVRAESVTIGKGPAAMLRVDGTNMADLHAVINVNDDGSVQLLDLGSTGGTRVNGERVSNVALASGDAIEVGEVRIVIHMGEEVNDDRTDEAGAPMMPSQADDASAAPQEQSTEDVMAFVMRSVTSESSGGDRSRPKVLEVAEIWGDMIMDVKQYAPGSKPITLGTATAYRWRYLGMPIAWVPGFFGKVDWVLGPWLSEVQEEWKNEFYVPTDNLPGEGFALIEWDGSRYVCNFSNQWAGFVDIGDQRLLFQDLISSGKAKAVGGNLYQVPITEDTRVLADIGHVVFFAHMVHPGRKAVSQLAERIDYPFLTIMSFILFFGILAGVIIATTPPPPENEVMEVPERFVELLLEKPKEEIKQDKNPDAGEGAKAKKEEGKVGKKDAKMEKAKGNKVEMNRQQLDKEIAENAGVLGALRDGAELDSVFGSSALSSDINAGIGGLIGARGVQFGSGGLGSRGSGLGGGGTADGLGGLGTKGRGSGASGYGSGGGHFGAKGEGNIGTIGGEAIILGALDKSLIDAVIRRNLNQIRYCYQRELTKNPALTGKVVIKFVIAKDGTVSSSSTKSSSMNNKAVEDCINGRFMRFQFPQPKGGGIVIVSYPFIFSPG